METVNAYISIGNSDDKLSQMRWSSFVGDMKKLINWLKDEDVIIVVHGFWLSSTDAPWQNANWCVEVDELGLDDLRGHLARLAWAWDQDSIALAVAPVEFIKPRRPNDEHSPDSA